MQNKKTIIIGQKQDAKAVLLKIEYDPAIPADKIQAFAKEAVNITCTAGIGDKLFEYEESQHSVLGGEFEILDSAVSFGDIFEVLVNQDGTQGALADLQYTNSKISNRTALQSIVSSIAKVASEIPVEYITEDQVFDEEHKEDEKKKVLFNQPYPDGSGKTIAQFLSENDLNVTVTISRVGKSSITN